MRSGGFLLARYFRYLVRFKLTPYGRVLVLLTFFAALGSITVEIPIYQLFCALFFLPAVAELVGTVLRPRVELRCQLPDQATQGVPLCGVVEITNQGWFPAFDLMVGLFELAAGVKQLHGSRVVASLRSGQTVAIPFELLPMRRGRCELGPVHVHSTFPFNLMRFGGGVAPLPPLIVLPAYQSLDYVDLPLGMRCRPTHPAPLVGARGESPEYVGNREYIIGEPAVRLDFRAWARIGRPVVREYQDEYSFRSALIVDTYQPVPRPVADQDSVEAAISLAAALGEAMHLREVVVDLVVAGPEIYLFQTPHVGTRFDSLLEILAVTEATANDPFPQLIDHLMQPLEGISSVVLVLQDWDDARREVVEWLREAGLAVKVLLVREAPSTVACPRDEEWCHTVSPQLVLAGEVRSV